jgi:cation:H+ antiporter
MLPEWYTNPSIVVASGFVVFGFYLLIKGADYLVDGSVIVANKFRLSPAVIGATIVAFGTSMPELAVSVGANLMERLSEQPIGVEGPSAIAVGNIVGSNIFNIGAILGITAILTPVKIPHSTTKFEYPFMVVSLIMLILFSFFFSSEGYKITQLEGVILFVGLIIFTYFSIVLGKVPAGEIEEAKSHHGTMNKAMLSILIGSAMLCIGGEVSLNGALTISEKIGLSKRVIGLTVMAIGTSLPELVTSVQAVRKKQVDIAVGNIIGSNLFNIFSVLGITAMINHLSVSEASLYFDYWWMLGLSLFIFPYIVYKKELGRKTGIFLVTSLCIYVSIVLTVK